MWNYDYILTGVLVMAILLCHYLAMPRANIQINRTYVQLICLQLGTLVLDLLASLADENYAILPGYWLYLLNMGYFVLYHARGFWFFRITCDILHIRPESDRRKSLLISAVFLITELVTLSSFFTGAVFRIGEEGYVRGPLYDILYVCWFFYLALAVALLLRNAKSLSRYEFFSALGFNLILIAGNVARILLPRYLIMNTFCTLSLLSVYLAFENPDLYLSTRRIAFNMAALREELSDIVARGHPFHILAFAIQDFVEMRGIYGGTQMDRGVDMIAHYLTLNYPSCRVFYLRNGCFTMLGPQKMPWDLIHRKIVERFQDPWAADNAELYLAAAFVMIDSDSCADSADKTVTNLVSALHRASQAVDSVIELNNTKELDRDTEVKRALDLSLEQDRVEIFLQPLIDSRTRRLAGVEVLSRIRGTDGKLISPGNFVPIAERSGKINNLGEQVLEKACRFISGNDLEAMGIHWVNVNLSPIQCMKKDLSERFLTILAENRVSPDMIRLEITEQAVADIPLLERHIETLRLSGFHFALDDYGSGYSNLSRVKHYPFVNIKLDMEVVWDYYHDQDQLLPSIVKAFKEMDYSVTAEGIESEEMADSLTAIGCDYLQGYYFSKPLPVEEFVRKYGAARA